MVFQERIAPLRYNETFVTLSGWWRRVGKRFKGRKGNDWSLRWAQSMPRQFRHADQGSYQGTPSRRARGAYLFGNAPSGAAGAEARFFLTVVGMAEAMPW